MPLGSLRSRRFLTADISNFDGRSCVVRSSYFDPEDLRREKQRAREKDDEDLREGRVTREQLRRRNGFFSGLDFSGATVRIPKNE